MSQRDGNAVVVPAIDAASSSCFLRSLGGRGVRTIAVSEMESPPAFWSRHADETVQIPSFEDDVVAYKDGLLSLAKRDDVRAIPAFREMDVYVLSKYADEFGDHLEPLWPPMDALRAAHDRVRLFEAAAEAGVCVPETRLLSEVEGWDREQIVKDRYAVLAGDYVDSYAESQYGRPGGTTYLESGSVPDRERIRREMGHDPIVQEYVSGEEYALWALYDHGDPVATCLKHQVRGFRYAGGTSVYRKTVDAPELEDAGRTLLDELDWHGAASVQFIRDEETGEFALLEINPRFWGSLSCAVRAGVDFPDYFWRMANGETVRPRDGYDAGVATHRLSGELTHLLSILRADNPYVEPPDLGARALEIARSCYDQPNFDYLTLDDPGPFVRDVLNVVGDSVNLFDGIGLFESESDDPDGATKRSESDGRPDRGDADESTVHPTT